MTIVGCFLEYDGKFLILFRHPHKPNGNTWGLPAGKVEPHESNDKAMLRELFEETGYKAKPAELNHVGDFIFGKAEDTFTFVTYRVKLQKPIAIRKEDAAHAEFRWVTAEQCSALPNLIPDFHKLLELTGYIA